MTCCLRMCWLVTVGFGLGCGRYGRGRVWFWVIRRILCRVIRLVVLMTRLWIRVNGLCVTLLSM